MQHVTQKPASLSAAVLLILRIDATIHLPRLLPLELEQLPRHLVVRRDADDLRRLRSAIGQSAGDRDAGILDHLVGSGRIELHTTELSELHRDSPSGHAICPTGYSKRWSP